MRVLLINPFYPLSETPSPPLGLAFLAATLERAAVEVRILDLVVLPYSRQLLESVLRDFTPDMVGATCVTMTFDHAARVIEDAKSIAPDVFTVMGGPHVTFCASQTMESLPALDCIVLGEGEETVVELARAGKQPRDLRQVSGIVYRDGSRVVATEASRPPVDIDTLPLPARHLLPLGRYRALGLPVSMTTSRGCPFHCIFCVGRKMVGAKVRYRTPEKVVDEMELLKSLDFRQVNIADDLFTADKRHCIAVCDEIINRNLGLRWTSFARVDTVSLPLLAKMKEAGCHTVSFGVESANARILDTVRKGITVEQVLAAVEMCNEVGISPNASFILGLPGETPETLRETVYFGEKLKGMGVAHGFHLLAPFPGTQVREECDRFDLKILTDDWSEYHANSAIVETPTVSKETMDKVVHDWHSEFVAYLGDIRERRDRGEASEDEAWPLVNLERSVLLYDLMMGGVVEEKGSWPAEGSHSSETEALLRLAEAIDGSSGHDRDTTFEALRYSFQNHDLRFDHKNGKTVWQWVDFLEDSDER